MSDTFQQSLQALADWLVYLEEQEAALQAQIQRARQNGGDGAAAPANAQAAALLQWLDNGGESAAVYLPEAPPTNNAGATGAPPSAPATPAAKQNPLSKALNALRPAATGGNAAALPPAPDETAPPPAPTAAPQATPAATPQFDPAAWDAFGEENAPPEPPFMPPQAQAAGGSDWDDFMSSPSPATVPPAATASQFDAAAWDAFGEADGGSFESAALPVFDDQPATPPAASAGRDDLADLGWM